MVLFDGACVFLLLKGDPRQEGGINSHYERLFSEEELWPSPPALPSSTPEFGGKASSQGEESAAAAAAKAISEGTYPAESPLLEESLPDITAAFMEEMFAAGGIITKGTAADEFRELDHDPQTEGAAAESDSESSGWSQNDELSDDEDAFRLLGTAANALPSAYQNTPSEQIQRAVARVMRLIREEPTCPTFPSQDATAKSIFVDMASGIRLPK